MASATQQRAARNAAVIARHPRWKGIRHPDLIDLPRQRISRIDMLPAVRLGADREWERRARWNADVVAAHPRWHGIRHPERLVFDPPPPDEREARHRYRAAVARALDRLAASARIAEQISEVADMVEKRPRPWGADPRLAAAPTVARTGPRDSAAPVVTGRRPRAASVVAAFDGSRAAG